MTNKEIEIMIREVIQLQMKAQAEIRMLEVLRQHLLSLKTKEGE